MNINLLGFWGEDFESLVLTFWRLIVLFVLLMFPELGYVVGKKSFPDIRNAPMFTA